MKVAILSFDSFKPHNAIGTTSASPSNLTRQNYERWPLSSLPRQKFLLDEFDHSQMWLWEAIEYHYICTYTTECKP